MSQALYRRYRSQRFSELVGQQGVTRVLCNAISRDRLSHAYLFCGPRGTGKTSVARIFSKAINCLNPVNGDCCGECEVCRSVAEGRAADVIEIDAASHRKVEETKEILIDRVGYAPLRYKRKVYIIDEVHMLSAHSFNALLKTLEEPPEHVIFCLCTTEPHQLPLTILSRCLRFDFHRLPTGELAKHLVNIASHEEFLLEEDAAIELAILAEGSARDSISLLDQLLVYCDSAITLADVRELFQLSDPQLLKDTADSLANSDSASLLAIWQDLARQGADAGQFLLRVSTEVKQRYLQDSNDGWRRALSKLWEGLNLLKFESFPALLVELTLLSAQQAYNSTTSAIPSFPNAATGEYELTSHQQRQRSQPSSFKPQQSNQTEKNETPDVTVNQRTVSSEHQNLLPKHVSSKPAGLKISGKDWEAVLAQLKASQLTTYALLQEDVIVRQEGSLLRLVFDQIARPAYRYIQQEKHIEPLGKTLDAAYGTGLSVTVEIAGEPSSQITIIAGNHSSVIESQLPDSKLLVDISSKNEDIPSSDMSYTTSTNYHKHEKNATSPEELGTGLGQTISTTDTSRPVTKQDVMSLFDAEELSEEES